MHTPHPLLQSQWFTADGIWVLCSLCKAIMRQYSAFLYSQGYNADKLPLETFEGHLHGLAPTWGGHEVHAGCLG